jgi:hypothetical protein
MLISGLCLANGCGGNASTPPNSPTPISNPPNSNSGQISGQVVDAQTKTPLATTFVSLEKRDSQNIERILQVTSTDANGNFTFQSVPSGTFEVAIYSDRSFPFYSWMVIFTVPETGNVGAVPLQPYFPAAEGLPGTAQGMVTSSPVAVDATIWVMAPVTQNGRNTSVIVPFTANGYLLKTNGTTISYGISTLATLPTIGVFSGHSVTYTANTSNGFVIDAQAFQSSLPPAPNCAPSELQTVSFVIPCGPGTINNVPSLGFANCK